MKTAEVPGSGRFGPPDSASSPGTRRTNHGRGYQDTHVWLMYHDPYLGGIHETWTATSVLCGDSHRIPQPSPHAAMSTPNARRSWFCEPTPVDLRHRPGAKGGGEGCRVVADDSQRAAATAGGAARPPCRRPFLTVAPAAPSDVRRPPRGAPSLYGSAEGVICRPLSPWDDDHDAGSNPYFLHPV